MPVVLAVAVGGSLGALSRYGVDSLIEHRVDSLFPWATFTMTELGHWGLAVANVALSATAGVAAVALGQALGRL